MASEKILNQKKKEVEELAEKFKKAKLVLLTDYKGINVEDVTKLRASLRTTDTEYKVIKNNITRRALEVCNVEGLEEQLLGTTAVIIGYEDYLEPLKAIYKYSKDNEFYKIKGGIIEGKVVPVEELITLANYHQERHLLLSLLVHYLAIFQNLQLHLVRLQNKKKQQRRICIKQHLALSNVVKVFQHTFV